MPEGEVDSMIFDESFGFIADANGVD